ncbi:hypothetical protein QBC40DRAFT_289586 [Triangularia verruculosa]|uniref:Uncharacterized protein n=1 Tax=Triangularia verruculosa TaxID=2587418 RepID=A0AAN6X802_9PEZI|nr:hypothetical protein QBC40DRAFT_289586 [Triangularia verruculosa]
MCLVITLGVKCLGSRSIYSSLKTRTTAQGGITHRSYLFFKVAFFAYCHSFSSPTGPVFRSPPTLVSSQTEMHSKLLVLGALPMLAFARAYPPLLRGRTEGGYGDGGYVGTPVKTCEDIEQQTCGDGCVPVDYTCCPTQEGACAPGFNCQLGDNDEYGCCPDGQECVGDGGAITTTFSTPLPTSSVPAYEEEPTPTDEVEEPPLTTAPAEDTEPTSTAPVEEPEPTVTSTLIDEDLPTATASDSYEPSATATQEPDSTLTSGDSATATEEPATTGPTVTGTLTGSLTDPITTSTSNSPVNSTSSSHLTTAPTSYTTSTIYTTTIQTITSCAPTVPSCPAGSGSVVIVTKTIAVSTTICPVTPTPIPTSKQPILPPVKPTYGCSQGVGHHCPHPTSPTNTQTTSSQPWGTAPAGYTGIYTGPLPTTTLGGASTTSRVPVTAGAGKGVQGASWIGGVMAAFAVFGLIL